jgi:AbrB family looped-hinge helix DNA binding protein
MTVSTVSAKGWVVIPKEIRDRYGIKKGTRIRFVEYGGVISIVPEPEDAREAMDALYGKFAAGPSLTAALLKDRAGELAREENEIESSNRSG